MPVGLKRGQGSSEYRHFCVVNLRQGPQDWGQNIRITVPFPLGVRTGKRREY